MRGVRRTDLELLSVMERDLCNALTRPSSVETVGEVRMQEMLRRSMVIKAVMSY